MRFLYASPLFISNLFEELFVYFISLYFAYANSIFSYFIDELFSIN